MTSDRPQSGYDAYDEHGNLRGPNDQLAPQAQSSEQDQSFRGSAQRLKKRWMILPVVVVLVLALGVVGFPQVTNVLVSGGLTSPAGAQVTSEPPTTAPTTVEPRTADPTTTVSASPQASVSRSPTTGTGPEVVIGIKIDQPGIGYRDGGDLGGLDVDVARYVARELGYGEVRFVAAPSAQRETLLQSRQVTMIVATYAITADRQEKVSFAGPYAKTQQDLLVRSADGITSPAQLNGRRLCSVAGSTAAQKVTDLFTTSVRLVDKDSYADCVAALAAGDVDAVTTDSLLLAGFAAEPQYRGQLKVVGRPFGDTEDYGIGIAKGDTELCGQINDALKKMIEEGAWEGALQENLASTGFTPPKDVTPTSAEPCQ